MNIFLFKVAVETVENSVNYVTNKDITTTSILSASPFGFEQVNVCWDVIKSSLSDFWSILKMLCSKCCSRPSDFYFYFLKKKKMQVTRLHITLEKFNQQVKQSCACNLIWRHNDK